MYTSIFLSKPGAGRTMMAFVLPCWIISAVLSGCTKFVTVDELKDQMLSMQVFTDEASANSAMYGLYRSMKDISFASNILATAAADEVTNYSTVQLVIDFATNKIPSNSANLPWSALYTMVYRANSAIEGLEGSTGVPPARRGNFLGEARFMRAYAYFYLVNFFGDVPLITTTDIRVSATAARQSAASVYEQIVTDLLEAQKLLAPDYNASGGAKTRVNKWAATAMLARVYLYLGRWEKAAAEATAVINSGLYPLQDIPASILSRNNTEAIFQLDRYSGEPFAIPGYYVSTAIYLGCSGSLQASFEAGDQRLAKWIREKTVLSVKYKVPAKFTTTVTTEINELETPLRIAEMYLVRAEALAMSGKYQDCVEDLNLLRKKHGGLSAPIDAPASGEAALDLVLVERKRELFTEGAHRWFDLKRTGRLDTVMSIEKPATWSAWAALFPIPVTDIQRNPNMVQNPGYQ